MITVNLKECYTIEAGEQIEYDNLHQLIASLCPDNWEKKDYLALQRYRQGGDDWFTPSEAAKLLRCSEQVIRSKARKGLIEKKFVGKKFLFVKIRTDLRGEHEYIIDSERLPDVLKIYPRAKVLKDTRHYTTIKIHGLQTAIESNFRKEKIIWQKPEKI